MELVGAFTIKNKTRKIVIIVSSIIAFINIFPLLSNGSGSNKYSISVNEQSLMKCLNGSEFSYIDFTSMPDVPTTREEHIGTKTEYVSVNEGYRIRYGYQGLKFIDLKIEYSMRGNYEHDKQVMMAYYNYLKEKESGKINVNYVVDKFIYPAFILDRYEPTKEFAFLSINCFFDDNKQRIIYVYYWNINQTTNVIANMDDFLKLKNTSMPKLLECIK